MANARWPIKASEDADFRLVYFKRKIKSASKAAKSNQSASFLNKISGLRCVVLRETDFLLKIC